MIFRSEGAKASDILLIIGISPFGDPLLPYVHNLAYGPLLEGGKIEDTVKSNHQTKNKVFSTILLFSLVCLQNNPKNTIGIDGSNDIMAYLYHRMCLTNKEYLGEYFVSIGVDWYVKLLISGGVEVDLSGIPYFKPKPEPFDCQRPATNLYRYYMFRLIN